MGLNSSLGIAISGLSTNQAQLDLISKNIANANSTGYIKRNLSVIESNTGGVQAGNVTRLLDTLVQKQLWTENAGGAYASANSTYVQQLDQLFGTTSSSASISALYNNFTQSLQSLASNPSSTTIRSQVVQYAQQLAGSLNDLSDGVQALRSNAESQIGDDVKTANNALQGLEDIQRQLNAAPDGDNTQLLDQRDTYIDQLSKLMDIKVSPQSNGSVNIYTNSGVTLFDGSKALRLQFDEQSNLTPNALYNSNASLSGVGQLKLVATNGTSIDVEQQNVFRSGEFKALLDLRDTVLPQAQTQLDTLAAGLSQALSDKSPASTAVTSGAQSGYDIDLTGLQEGNAVSISFTQGGVTKNIKIVDVDNPSSLPLPYGATGNPNDIVIGASFSGGVASAIASIQSALTAAGTNLQVSNTAGSTLRVLDDGTGASAVKSVGANITSTVLSGNGAALPLFVDGSGNVPYTGSFENGSQQVGFAGRIVVNPGIVADTSKLVVYGSGVDAGDATRPNALLDSLTNTTRQFSYKAGLTGTSTPYSGTVGDFLNGIIAAQGAASTQAQSLDAGQQVVVNSLQQKFATTSGVSVDEELSNLIQIQNAYSANARIISTVQSLFQILQQIQV